MVDERLTPRANSLGALPALLTRTKAVEQLLGAIRFLVDLS
jgi:hypothetical protein